MSATSPVNQASVPLRQATAPETSGPQLPIDVRRLRPFDLPGLLSIQQRLLLNQPGSGWHDADPIRAGLRQLLPLTRKDQPVFVAHGDGRPIGFAQYRIVGPDQRWLLDSLGAEMGVYEAQPVWEELMRFAVVTAGLDGVKRLYARIPEGSPALTAARRIGYAPYASESILAASLAPITQPDHDVRRQQQVDVWSIHQLYMAVVPSHVQHAEALTSHSWDITAPYQPGGVRSQGWLVEDGHLVIAYARAISRPDAHVLEFLVHPDHRAVFPQLLATAFADLAQMPARRLYAVVRGYQSELAPVLHGMGFGPHLEQDVHVKYTTAPARVPAMQAALYGAEVKEPVAKRVPTFLQGSSSDPSSEPSG